MQTVERLRDMDSIKTISSDQSSRVSGPTTNPHLKRKKSVKGTGSLKSQDYARQDDISSSSSSSSASSSDNESKQNRGASNIGRTRNEEGRTSKKAQGSKQDNSQIIQDTSTPTKRNPSTERARILRQETQRNTLLNRGSQGRGSQNSLAKPDPQTTSSTITQEPQTIPPPPNPNTTTDHQKLKNQPKKYQKSTRSTVYDTTSGRLTLHGLLQNKSHQLPPSSRDIISTSAKPLTPLDALFRSPNAPEIYYEDNLYTQHRHLVPSSGIKKGISQHLRKVSYNPETVFGGIETTAEVNERIERVRVGTLPDSDLLKALHRYASWLFWFKGRGCDGDSSDGENGRQSSVWKGFEETALLALGILVEEWVGEFLGEKGHLVFAEECKGFDADDVERVWRELGPGPKLRDEASVSLEGGGETEMVWEAIRRGPLERVKNPSRIDEDNGSTHESISDDSDGTPRRLDGHSSEEDGSISENDINVSDETVSETNSARKTPTNALNNLALKSIPTSSSESDEDNNNSKTRTTSRSTIESEERDETRDPSKDIRDAHSRLIMNSNKTLDSEDESDESASEDGSARFPDSDLDVERTSSKSENEENDEEDDEESDVPMEDEQDLPRSDRERSGDGRDVSGGRSISEDMDLLGEESNILYDNSYPSNDESGAEEQRTALSSCSSSRKLSSSDDSDSS